MDGDSNPVSACRGQYGVALQRVQHNTDNNAHVKSPPRLPLAGALSARNCKALKGLWRAISARVSSGSRCSSAIPAHGGWQYGGRLFRFPLRSPDHSEIVEALRRGDRVEPRVSERFRPSSEKHGRPKSPYWRCRPGRKESPLQNGKGVRAPVQQWWRGHHMMAIDFITFA